MADRVLLAIDAARRRLVWIHALQVSGRWLWVLAVASCLLICAHRWLFAFPLQSALLSLAALGTLAALVRGWLRRPSRALAVLTLDERFGLQERLASAYGIDRPRDAVELAVVEDAELAATGLDLARGLPVRLPRSWQLLPLAAALLALLVWQLPQADLLGWRAAAAQRRVEIEQLHQLAAELRAAGNIGRSLELQPRLVRSLAALADSLEAELPSWPGALRRVNDVFDRHESALEQALPFPLFLERFSASGERRIDGIRAAYRSRDFADAAAALHALAREVGDERAPARALAAACDNFAMEIGQADALRLSLQEAALHLQAGAGGPEVAACLQRAASELRLLAARDEALAALSQLRESLRRAADDA